MADIKVELTSIDIGFWDLTKFFIKLYFATSLAGIILLPIILLIFIILSAIFAY